MAKLQPGVIEAAQIARKAHNALKCINHLLAHTESGTTVDCGDLACVLISIQSELFGAVDELDAACGHPAVKETVNA